MAYLNTQSFFNSILDFLNTRITKLENITGCKIYKMIMLFEFVRLLKLSAIILELMLNNQIAIEQQFHGIVKSCPAHPVFVVFHLDIQGLDIKMTISKIDLL